MRRSTAQEISPETRAATSAASWPAEPYLGINYYTAADAALFGERDQEVEQCAALVSEFSTRMLVLQGKSGTGKSSFLRAGLIPRLEQQGSPFYFPRSEQGSSEPTFVRCTDDPVSRILALLAGAIENDPQLGSLPIGFRQAIGELVASATSEDRVDTALVILKILAVLSESMSQTLVLIIDQSEEILTLQTSRDPNNQRKAFFYLLEELCLRSLDVRVIIAIRTEFCGRFYDAFGINPNLRVTSNVRAGLEQFLLGPLPRDGIVAAILRPTLATPIEGYGIPREKYRFKYGEGVAEHIADDLLSHCGDSSTLPVLQIVCKELYNQVVIGKKCPKITVAHYQALGGVKGRVDAYIDDVLRGALQETGATSVSSADLVRWRRVLATLAARQEGNAVTTLIRAEHEIVNEAGRQELRGDIPKVLKTLSKHRWRLLRAVIGSTNGATLQYSLGHDAIAVALLKWDEAQQGLERTERERLAARRKLRSYFLALVCMLLSVAGVVAWQDYKESIKRNEDLIKYFNVDSGNFRLGIQLLLAAQSISNGFWGPFLDGEKSHNALAATLALSPILAGEGEAVGVDEDGTRIAILRQNSLSVIDLETSDKNEQTAFQFEPRKTLLGVPGMPAAGFVAGMPLPVVYQNGYLYWSSRKSDSMQILDLSADLKEPSNLSYSPVNFAAGFVQVTVPNRPNDANNWMKVLRVTPSQAIEADRNRDLPRSIRITWNGSSLWPIFSTQSDKFAYVGSSRKQEIYSSIMLSSLSDPSHVSFIYGLPSDRDTDFDSLVSLAFANSGRSLIVRDSPTKLRIFLATEDRQGRLDGTFISEVQIPEELSDTVQPRRKTMRPLLAAVKTDSEWRFAWLTHGGIAVIESDLREPEKAKSTAAIKTDLDESKSTKAVAGRNLLAGSAELETAFRLKFSRDGRFLVLLQRRMDKPMRYLVWDLDSRKSDYESLRGEDLRRKACRIAALDISGSLLTPSERFAWFRDSVEPCADLAPATE